MSNVNTRPKSPPRVEAMVMRSSPPYSTKVLLGNWVEDRIECPKDGTLYFPTKEKIDYVKMKPESRQPDFRLNKLNSSQCHSNVPNGDGGEYFLVFIEGSVPSIILHDSHDHCGNYATVNDIVYNHLPKPLCGPDQRYYKRSAHNYYPQPDFMKCFGNKTEWGLRKFMQHEWACTDVSDYIASLYDDTYVPPQSHQYLQPHERKAKNSSFTKQFRFKMTKPKEQKKKQ